MRKFIISNSKKNERYLACKLCGYEEKIDIKNAISEDYKIGDEIVRGNEVEIMEEDEPRPKITIECPKCNNNLAFHWEKYDDEGEIVLFYRCTKCRYVWMEKD